MVKNYQKVFIIAVMAQKTCSYLPYLWLAVISGLSYGAFPLPCLQAFNVLSEAIPMVPYSGKGAPAKTYTLPDMAYRNQVPPATLAAD